jgi:hypothetical protein
MTYVPDWEPIADALSRAVALGVATDEAKRQICAAISDRRIEMRLILAEDLGLGLDEMEVPRAELRIPPRLKPEDIDWTGSVPLKRWFPQPRRLEESVVLYGARVQNLFNRKVAVLQLRTADVAAIFGSPSKTVGADLPPSQAEPAAAGARSRVVSQAVTALWPNGIPDTLTIKERDTRMIAWAREHGLSVPSRRTIQRVLKQSNS